MNHFSKLSTFALLAFTLTATSACQDTSRRSDSGSDLQPPSADAFASLALDAREDLLQSFTIDADTLDTVVGEQGTTISFSWNAGLTYPDGSPVTGDVNLELIEIYDRGSMLVTRMPTDGRLPSGEPGQLISGGEHHVTATQPGESLALNGHFFQEAPTDNTGGFDPQMELFRAETEDGLAAGLQDNSVWVEGSGNGSWCCNDDESDTGNGNPFYTLTSDQFGWSNIDRWSNDPRPKTSVTVEVPEGWDITNCAIYVTDDIQPNTLTTLTGALDSPIFDSGSFERIPVGLAMHVILVTENDGDWSYGIQNLTVEGDDTVVFASAEDLSVTDSQGLMDALNALP